MFKRYFNFFYYDLFVDLGTTNIFIYLKDKGIVINEPSVVALRSNVFNKSDFLAVGNFAKDMLGRNPNNIIIIKPIIDSIISDFFIVKEMLKYFFNKINNIYYIGNNIRVLACVPVGSTKVDKSVIKESILCAGVNEVFLIESSIVSAIGAGLPISNSSGFMVVDIGGGTTKIAVISLNGVVYYSSIKVGGNKFDESIINYVKVKYGYLIGEVTAEKIKIDIGSAFFNGIVSYIEVRGISISKCIPSSFILNSKEIIDALFDPLNCIIDSILSVLEKCKPELASDIFEKGIVLTGGGSLLRNLDLLFISKIKVPFVVANDPLKCVVMGGGKILDLVGFDFNDFFCDV